MKCVRCAKCNVWVGREEEVLEADKAPFEKCPNCLEAGGIIDVDNASPLTPDMLEQLWLLFGDIPIDNEDRIGEDFLGFAAGTNRFLIWEWFDECYPDGVYSLAYPAQR